MQSLMNFMTGGGGSGTTEATASTVDVKALLGASTDSLKEGGDKTKGGSLTTVGDVLKDDLKVLMFYFSMHNCPPCREFTPLLAELYKDENESERNMEVIFFSGDPQEDVYNEYYGEMPWKAMPFKDARLKPIARQYQQRVDKERYGSLKDRRGNVTEYCDKNLEEILSLFLLSSIPGS